MEKKEDFWAFSRAGRELVEVNHLFKNGITNDPNDWAKEQGDEKYILNLLLRIINVSVKSVEIIKSLPTVNFEE